jgi:predicted nucleotidyltransferase
MVPLSPEQDAALDAVRESHGIVLILAHGSRVSGRARADSDLDLAVLPRTGRLGLDARIDLGSVFPGLDTDIADLSRADPLLLGEIQKNCRLLSGDPTVFQEFRIHAFRRYQDYRPRLRLEAETNRRRLESM